MPDGWLFAKVDGVMVMAKETKADSKKEPLKRRRQAKGSCKTAKKPKMKDRMAQLLETAVQEDEMQQQLQQMGLEQQGDYMTLLVLSLFKKAMKTGDVPAFREIRSLLGEDADEDNGQMEELIRGLKEPI